MEKFLWTVQEDEVGLRVDKVLSMHLEDFSRTSLEKSFDEKKVLLDGQVVAKKIRVELAQEISIELPSQKQIEVLPEKMDIEIVFEDDDIIVINKAQGVVVHSGAGNYTGTLCHGLMHYTNGNLSKAGGSLRPGVVHRLDKQTSGLMVFAKTDKAYFALIKIFSGRQITKRYYALCKDKFNLISGVIEKPIARHRVVKTKMCVHESGKDATTIWNVVKNFKHSSLVDCHILTGRTHQIRVHLSTNSHPILGDTTYGYCPTKALPMPPRIMLHSYYLEFPHPTKKKKLKFKLDLPEDFKEYILGLEK